MILKRRETADFGNRRATWWWVFFLFRVSQTQVSGSWHSQMPVGADKKGPTKSLLSQPEDQENGRKLLDDNWSASANNKENTVVPPHPCQQRLGRQYSHLREAVMRHFNSPHSLQHGWCLRPPRGTRTSTPPWWTETSFPLPCLGIRGGLVEWTFLTTH